MNLLTLDDTKLAALHAQVQTEVTRRTKAATDGHDPATIIRGQEMGKRAVVVAAAGGHSLHLIGPPNIGKTMLRAVALELGLGDTFESHPCPCGHYSDPRGDCKCTATKIAWHRGRFLIDDITLEVPPVPERELSGTFKGTSLADMREQIARMTKHESLALEVHCRNLLKASVAELGLDAARRETIIQIARTIANLDGCESIEAQHISEAINYRMLSS